MINIDELRLEELNAENIENRLHIINSDDNFLAIGLKDEIDEAENLHWFEEYSDDLSKDFSFVKSNGRYCGLVGLSHIDKIASNAELFIVIDGDYKEQGVASKAIELIINYAKYQVGLESIYLTVSDTNIAAINLYTRLGFDRIDDDLLHNESEFAIDI